MQPVRTGALLSQIVIDRPECARIMERWQLDYCCQGLRTLEDACRDRGLDPAEVAASLEAAEVEESRVDLNALSTLELLDHIESTHHVYVREELPRLSALFGKVTSVHRLNHPELVLAQAAFEALRAELEPHLLKEERILFPLIRSLVDGKEEAQDFHCGSVGNPIRAMEYEHDAAGALMARVRELLDDLRAPADACGSYRTLLLGLEAFALDLHTHVHKENYVLFPRALQ